MRFERIGRYAVTTLLGEGGMGQVWQATDTQLHRQVALKILPDAFADDPDRLVRFQREAQVLAKLNHPGIASIYGIEAAEGARALVLELVEGPTLADRISKGPIPVDVALPIAKQIAEALEAAHEAGVIHRDLKPANIKVREDGTVKVLDFGLAKALDTAPVGDPDQSPTLTAAATQIGVIMGTAAYMSPEQAAGRLVDNRSDIWSFGVVLFEMLTGRQLFTGETVSDVIADVLKTAPDMASLPDGTPGALTRLLQRCLEKNRKVRVPHVGMARIEIVDVLTAPTIESRPSAPAPRGWRQLLLTVSGVAAVVGLTTGAVVWRLVRPDPPPVVRFAVAQDDTAFLTITAATPDIAISPLGTHIAYLTGGGNTGGEQLHVRSLDQFAAETLVAEGLVVAPFFSADSESVGFSDRSTNPRLLKRVSVEGGPTSTICELDGELRGASWGANTIIFATSPSGSGLWQVPAAGGKPEQLTTPNVEQGERGHSWPEILPGGEAVLFTIIMDPIEDSQIAVLSLKTGEQQVVVRGGAYPRYARSGHLLFGIRGNLWAVGFDVSDLETVGDPVPVQEGLLTKPVGVADFGVSANGSLVYVPDVAGSEGGRSLVWVDRQGREEALRAPPAPYENPRISPDGRYITVEVRDAENSEVMVYDLERDIATRLTFHPGQDRYPLWSPDGQRVVFSSDREGTLNIYSKAGDGTGPVERLTTSGNRQWPQSWSADGQSLVILDSGDQMDIHVMSLGADGQTEELISTDVREFFAEVSPNDRWIAYVSDELGQREVYVRPFPDVDNGLWQISRDGGTSPVWGPDGRELFFRAIGSSDMMVVAVDTEPTFDHGNPEFLFAGPYLV